MSIVSSVIVEDRQQRDGRRSIREQHTDQVAVVHEIVYLADVATDANALLAVHATTVSAQLTIAEITSNIADVATNGSLATPTTTYSTPAQNFAALRRVYQFATRTQAIMIGDFLNTLTDTQLENAFNLTVPQVTNLRTNKLQPAATAAASIRAAVGQ